MSRSHHPRQCARYEPLSDRRGGTDARDPSVPRLAFRLKEVAESLGVSEGLIRQILPELPHLRIGTALLFPVDLLGEWLRQQSEARGDVATQAVREILEKLNE